MSAGTLTLTNNSAAVTGSGTAFTTELAAGDFIVVTVGGIPYTLAIKTVNSNTSLTLVSNYTGPTQAGAAWYAVPRVAMNLVTAALVAQSAEAMRGLNYDKQNWQRIFSGTGNVTVTLPDGSSFTGPAWNSFTLALDGKADKVSGAVPVDQGGTGATTKEDARSNLGLGSAATRNVQNSLIDTTSGAMLQVNSFGLGATNSNILSNANLAPATGFWGGSGQANTNFFDPYAPLMHMFRSPTTYTQIQVGMDARLAVRAFNGTSLAGWRVFWSDGNTTVDTNGFIKRASPVIKLYGTGMVECNEEAEGVTASREAEGVYRVMGSLGLNPEGWTVEIPQDINGNFLCFVDIKTSDDGMLTVSVFRRRFDVESAMVIAGDPMDIPDERWIDLRLEMPEDSAWNQRQKDAAEPAS
ncbi:phage tail protein [Enterobacter kobei]|uniref:phage tail fiber protein n=1 Tax=Enterobacter kobei TaxID=208224 RepID=UPI002FD6986D